MSYLQTSNLTAEQLLAIGDEAREFFETWGEYVDHKHFFKDLLARHRNPHSPALTAAQCKALHDYMQGTLIRSAHMDEKWSAFPESEMSESIAVKWSDDDVVAAIRHLTSKDDDMASYANNIGWSRADTAIGHWCSAQLKIGKQDLGIKVARTIVRKYVKRQLAPARVISLEARNMERRFLDRQSMGELV